MRRQIFHGFSLLLLTLLFNPLCAQWSPNNCVGNTAFHIVVLGSSTAAGSGPSHPDSAWVNRYRNHLQSINPANQVTNLAQGGYTTYQIMPNDFVPPASRPLPDTNKNMTRALSLNPDGIIINMPSNDSGQGFSIGETMSNFDSLYAVAQSAGVPVWICTTQPVNGNAARVQLQMDTRDSIIAHFNPYDIDFWNTIADTAGRIESIYDKDGTHLNNAGHRILWSRAVDENILNQVYTSVVYPDIQLSELYYDSQNLCGDSLQKVWAVLTNLGTSIGASIPLNLFAENLSLGSNFNYPMSKIGGLGNCITDTVEFEINTAAPGQYAFTVTHSLAADLNPLNDTVRSGFQALGIPTAQALPDTACTGNTVLLELQVSANDQVMWYDDPVKDSIIHMGFNFATGILNSTQLFYADAVRGLTTNVDSVFTTDQSTIDWNGTMFNLHAKEDIELDSFALKVADIGVRVVDVWVHNGPYQEADTLSGLWTFLGSDTLNVTNANDMMNAKIGGLSISKGDTIGIYIFMNDAAVRLSYRNAGTMLSRSTNELELITGIGKGYNWGQTYNPRDWNGKVFYHHGFNPEGQCNSGRVPVEALIQNMPVAELGPDTSGCDSVTLEALSNVGAIYAWSTGDMGNQLIVSSSGVYSVEVSNTCGNDFNAILVDINVAPVAGFMANSMGLILNLTDQSTSAISWSWDFGDGSSSTFQNPSHVYATPGTYTIIQIVSNACGTDTLVDSNVVILASIEESLNEIIQLNIYPNPNTGTFHLESNITIETLELKMFDAVGRKISLRESVQSPYHFIIEIENNQSGIYFLKMKSGNEILVRKIVLY